MDLHMFRKGCIFVCSFFVVVFNMSYYVPIVFVRLSLFCFVCGGAGFTVCFFWCFDMHFVMVFSVR